MVNCLYHSEAFTAFSLYIHYTLYKKVSFKSPRQQPTQAIIPSIRPNLFCRCSSRQLHSYIVQLKFSHLFSLKIRLLLQIVTNLLNLRNLLPWLLCVCLSCNLNSVTRTSRFNPLAPPPRPAPPLLLSHPPPGPHDPWSVGLPGPYTP